eukprot:5969094-Pyramimonas_sp.AAC.1
MMTMMMKPMIAMMMAMKMVMLMMMMRMTITFFRAARAVLTTNRKAPQPPRKRAPAFRQAPP